LILLHHDSKKGGKDGRGVAGAHAFIGTVDIFLELMSGASENQRRLSGRGRILTIDDLIYERHEDGSMVVVGGRLSDKAKLVLDATTYTWETTAAIIKRAACSPSHAQRVFKELANRNLLERDPPVSERATGKTVKWRRVPEVE
jgi:hypothetical protein